MDIAVTREIKPREGRVAFLPAEVETLVAAGHGVFVETAAGAFSGAADTDYAEVGAEIVDGPAAAFAKGEMIVKVKEILPVEYGFLEPRHTLFTNIHSALNRELTDLLLELGLTGIAAEETHVTGSPNSALAGEVGAFDAVRLCLAPFGGSGRHFGPRYGAPAIKAVVIGLGGVGRGALRTLLRLGVSVTGLDVDQVARFRTQLDWDGSDFTADDVAALPGLLADADLVVNCVLWDKSRSDHLIDRAMLRAMKPTAVIADISCDTAGAVETCRPTTWDEPVYTEEGIRHYCVDNIPGAVPATASAGYGRAILPFVRLIADMGVIEACRRQPWLARGLSFFEGTLTHAETGHYQDRPFTPVDEILEKAG